MLLRVHHRVRSGSPTMVAYTRESDGGAAILQNERNDVSSLIGDRIPTSILSHVAARGHAPGAAACCGRRCALDSPLARGVGPQQCLLLAAARTRGEAATGPARAAALAWLTMRVPAEDAPFWALRLRSLRASTARLLCCRRVAAGVPPGCRRVADVCAAVSHRLCRVPEIMQPTLMMHVVLFLLARLLCRAGDRESSSWLTAKEARQTTAWRWTIRR